jgi:hypothetical protein
MVVVLVFISSLLACINAGAQSKWVYEQYNYIKQPDAAVFVPMVHFETNDNWYAELRYNYEDVKTLSLFAGKTLTGGETFEYTVTPMAGYSAGIFTGVSLAVNAEAAWKKFYISAQSQYSIATRKNATDFFFNWSELGYAVSDRLFTGVAMQYTRQEDQADFEPGFLAGLSFKNISFPFYVFSPFRPDRYFVLGMNYEYTLKKKNKPTIVN